MSATTNPQVVPLSRQRWFVAALVLLFLGLGVQYTFKVGDQHRSAILRWRPQIQQINNVDIYQRFTYPNPPIMALLLKPVVDLPPLAGSLAWFYLKVAMTLMAFFWVFKLVESPGHVFPSWAKALVILMSLRPIMGDLSHGNVNLFILFLVIAALYAFHRGFDFSTGVILGLAVACKVTPALFIPYFLWKRAWKTLAGFGAGLVLFLFLVPGLYLGMARNVDLFHSWYDCMIKPYMVKGQVTTEHVNQSLPGLVYRWFSPEASLNDKDNLSEFGAIAELDPRILGWIVKGIMAGFGVLVVWTCRTPTQPRHGWRLAAEFSLILLGMLLFSERTWKHHCVTLLLPFTVLIYYVAVCRPGPQMRYYLVGTLVAVLLLMMATSTGLVDFWDRTAKLAQADGAYVWAYFLLIAALAIMLRRKDVGVKESINDAYIGHGISRC
ncbi:MAG TPA: glycosyltransferase family 87 protein [Gemmataceae bacterium]|nr:glycosyltransferase family 87 protein [Gemmataceae bacterium]